MKTARFGLLALVLFGINTFVGNAFAEQDSYTSTSYPAAEQDNPNPYQYSNQYQNQDQNPYAQPVRNDEYTREDGNKKQAPQEETSWGYGAGTNPDSALPSQANPQQPGTNQEQGLYP